MQFSLNARQNHKYLLKANEIKFQYRDIDIIPEYAAKYPEAKLVIEILPSNDWEVSKIKDAFILSHNKLTVCVPQLKDPRVEELVNLSIPFYWGYPISTAWELDAILKTGVSQIKIEAPLFFQQDVLKDLGVQVRLTPNVAHQGFLPFTGVNGSWVRPEDINKYENIDIIEFEDCDLRKEQALYRIYAEQQEWPGQLSMIISNLELDCTNRMLPPDFTEARLNCGQRCVTGTCRICYRYFDLADPKKLKNYLAKIEKKN